MASKQQETKQPKESDVYNLVKDRFSVMKSQVMNSLIEDHSSSLTQDQLKKIQKSVNTVFSQHEDGFSKDVLNLGK